jgi:hypothetical protein
MSHMGELDGKVAVITGAGSGMARASARVFVREGAKVVGADISGREKETAEELGDVFVPFHADVSREADVEAMFAAALEAFGKVDAVLHVAGIGSGARWPTPWSTSSSSRTSGTSGSRTSPPTTSGSSRRPCSPRAAGTARVCRRSRCGTCSGSSAASSPTQSATARRAAMRTWTAEEARAFDDATAGHELGIAFHPALTCSLRRGEGCGLKWSDVDLDRGALAVQRARVAHGYDVTEGDPKSGKARTISLGATTVAAARASARAARSAPRAGIPRAEYVVTRADGTLPHPMTVSYFFDDAQAAVGVPRIRFHDLRHTHATLLLEAGEHPKVVQERLGHSSNAITLDVNSHVTQGMQEGAAARLDAAIFGAGRESQPVDWMRDRLSRAQVFA